MIHFKDLKANFLFLIGVHLCFSLDIFIKALILTKIMWGMIKIGNLILRTMALVDLTNSRYFQIYELLFRKLNTWNFEHLEF